MAGAVASAAAAALDAASLARWRADPIAFIEEVLHDPETRKPYRLLPAERAFLEHAFQTDAGGRLKYPEQVYACPKKSGKTAFSAMHCLTTTLLFGGAYPEATICANDLEQSVGRVFEAIRKIIVCSPLLRAEAKITEGRITFPAIDATITAIASDYAGAAGGNQCIACFDELWGYTSERSRRLWDEMVPPPTRKTALRLTTTYAGFEGESVLLEELHKRGMALPEVAPSLRAGDGLLMAWHHEPIAPWQDERWLSEMRRSLRPNAFLRMIENRFATTESSFIDLSWWDNCVDPAATPVVAQHWLPVTVGIDASVKRDSTAIVATHWDRQRQKVLLVWHRIYQPTPDDPLDFEAAIEATVLDLHARFSVRQTLYDPFQMASTAQRLQRAGVRMEEYPQNVPNLTASSQNLYELIKGRNIVAYPDPQLRLALSRAVAVEGSRGWKISKEKQTHKIDVVVALAMAALAAIQTQSKYRYDTSLNWVSGPSGPDDNAAEDFLRQRFQAHLRFGGRRW
jgi:phage terminase large subunit-like protein